MANDTNLVLPVNTYWGGLIERKQIDWDYREIKPYWIARFCDCASTETNIHVIEKSLRKFDTVTFMNRRTGRRMVFEVDDIIIVNGSDYKMFQYGMFYFIVRLGERIQ